jgi:hypothetical protein
MIVGGRNGSTSLVVFSSYLYEMFDYKTSLNLHFGNKNEFKFFLHLLQ